MRATATDIAGFGERLASPGRIEARRMFGGTGRCAADALVALEIEGPRIRRPTRRPATVPGTPAGGRMASDRRAPRPEAS